MADATHERDAIMAELKAELEHKVADSKAAIDAEAGRRLAIAKAGAVRERESAIARAEVGARKRLFAARGEIIGRALGRLEARLDEFTKTEGYRRHLARSAAEALRAVGYGAAGDVGAADAAGVANAAGAHGGGGGAAGAHSGGGCGPGSGANGGSGTVGADARREFSVTLAPGDYSKHRADIAALAPDADIHMGGADLIGGCKAANHLLGIYADNTFRRMVSMCEDKMLAASGLRIGAGAQGGAKAVAAGACRKSGS